MIARTLRPRDRRVARHLIGGKPVLIAGTMRQVSRFHSMLEQAEACRRKAAECERALVLATRPAVQAIYRDLARQWHEMAEQSEDLERRHSNSRLPSAKPDGPATPPANRPAAWSVECRRAASARRPTASIRIGFGERQRGASSSLTDRLYGSATLRGGTPCAENKNKM